MALQKKKLKLLNNDIMLAIYARAHNNAVELLSEGRNSI